MKIAKTHNFTVAEKESCYSGVRNKRCLHVLTNLKFFNIAVCQTYSICQPWGNSIYCCHNHIEQTTPQSVLVTWPSAVTSVLTLPALCLKARGKQSVSNRLFSIASFIVICNTSDKLMKCRTFCLFHDYVQDRT